MRVLSTFSGISAASVAWKRQGFEFVGYCEPSAFPCHVLNERCGATAPKYLPAAKGFVAKRYAGITGGNVINYGDIQQITDDDLRALGPVDILEGGSPCQSFSIAGLRGGLNDGRGNLMLSFAQLALRMKEINGLRLVVWENVKGVLSDKSNGFGCLLGALAGGRASVEPPGTGFTTAGHLLVGTPEDAVDEVTIGWRVLDSQFLGVAQRRERVFLIASFDPAIDAGALLFESPGERWCPAPRSYAEEDTSGGAQGSAGGVMWPPFIGTMSASGAGTARTAGQGNELDFVIIQSEVIASLSMDSKDCITMNPKTSYCLLAHDAKGAQAVIQKTDGMVCRRLTPLECERLQGFSDRWTEVRFEGRTATDAHRYHGIGNSMTVQAMEYIGHRIKLIHSEAYPLEVTA